MLKCNKLLQTGSPLTEKSYYDRLQSYRDNIPQTATFRQI